MSSDTPFRNSTVRVGQLVNLPTLLLDLNCDPGPVFESVGFKRDEFDNPEHRVSFLEASYLLAECVNATGCEHFGLLLGTMAKPSHLGIAGFLTRTASTVGQSLEALVENMDLHDQGAICTLDIETDYVRLTYYIHQPNVRAISQIQDMATTFLVKLMRSLCGNQWNATLVHLVRKKPHNSAPYTRFFRAPVLFDSETCCIVFNKSDLKLIPPAADELLFHHLAEEATVLHKMQNNELMDSLSAVLLHGLLLHRYSASDIADVFGIQERTLHRRLQSAGTSFRQELDRVRESMSFQMLESSSLPVCEIATALGYADSSGFIRAFQRWTGSSPASWRKQGQLN